MNARDFMACASILISDGDARLIADEAKWRTGITRAYYAVFLTARDRWFPRKQGNRIRHKHILRKARQELGDDRATRSKALYQMRQRSDYDVTDVISRDDALACVGLAEDLLAEMEF